MTQEQEHELIFEAFYTINKVIDLFTFQNSDEQRYWFGRRNVLEMLIDRMGLYRDYLDWIENKEK